MAVLDRSTGGNFPVLLVLLIRFPGGIWQEPWDQCSCLPSTREVTNFLLQVLEEQPEGVVTVAIAAHYLSGEDKRSILGKLLNHSELLFPSRVRILIKPAL